MLINKFENGVPQASKGDSKEHKSLIASHHKGKEFPDGETTKDGLDKEEVETEVDKKEMPEKEVIQRPNPPSVARAKT